jgi:hypothetical protein
MTSCAGACCGAPPPIGRRHQAAAPVRLQCRRAALLAGVSAARRLGIRGIASLVAGRRGLRCRHGGRAAGLRSGLCRRRIARELGRQHIRSVVGGQCDPAARCGFVADDDVRPGGVGRDRRGGKVADDDGCGNRLRRCYRRRRLICSRASAGIGPAASVIGAVAVGSVFLRRRRLRSRRAGVGVLRVCCACALTVGSGRQQR